ncbi:hypothetical protein HC928_02505 [bacterium]|nr:hypothetical protein [bacterium]
MSYPIWHFFPPTNDLHDVWDEVDDDAKNFNEEDEDIDESALYFDVPLPYRPLT